MRLYVWYVRLAVLTALIVAAAAACAGWKWTSVPHAHH